MPRSRPSSTHLVDELERGRHDPVEDRTAEADPRAAAALAGLRPEASGTPGARLVARLAPGGRAPAHLLALGVAAVVVAAAGWWLLRPPAAPIEASLPLAAAAEPASGDAAGSSSSVSGAGAGATTTSAPAEELVVQAAGAVVRGGVYRLPPGSRVDDLVRAAGGLAPDADRDRVNLAAAVADGERVWVPRAGQAEVPEVVAGAGGGASSSVGGGAGDGGAAGTASSGPVDLNTATAADLDTLPGVGPATAAAILAYRQEHGRFGSVDELLEVRGIGEAKLEQLRSAVTV